MNEKQIEKIMSKEEREKYLEEYKEFALGKDKIGEERYEDLKYKLSLYYTLVECIIFDKYAKDAIGIEKFTLTKEWEKILKEKPYTSKIGGKPAVPKNFNWPIYISKNTGDRIPLTFLMQINLKDAKKYDPYNLLPKKGVLSFFYEFNEMNTDVVQNCTRYTRYRDCVKVFYFSNEKNLKLQSPPKERIKTLPISEIPISFEKVASVNYDYFRDTILDEYGLGWPYFEYIADERDYWEGSWVGDSLLNGNGEGMHGYPIRQDLDKYINLISLLEIPGVKICNDRILYFWISKEELKNCNFDNVWVDTCFDDDDEYYLNPPRLRDYEKSYYYGLKE